MTGAREVSRGGARKERSRVVAGRIGMLGRRQVAPRRADDPLWIHVVGGGVGAGGGCPPLEGNKEAGILIGAGQLNKYVTISDIS